MRRISRYFLQGLLILVPIAATVWVVYAVFLKIDGLFDLRVPGLGFVATLLLILAVGFFASSFLARKLVALADTLFGRLPLIKMIYSSIKDLLNAFVGDKKSFSRAVQVKLTPDGGLRAIGFVTNESLDDLSIEDSAAVYLPQSYNFAGNLIVVSKDRIIPIDTDSGNVMAFVISGGVSSSKTGAS